MSILLEKHWKAIVNISNNSATRDSHQTKRGITHKRVIHIAQHPTEVPCATNMTRQRSRFFLPRNPDCHSAGTNNKLIVPRMILRQLAFGGRVLVDMTSLERDTCHFIIVIQSIPALSLSLAQLKQTLKNARFLGFINFPKSIYSVTNDILFSHKFFLFEAKKIKADSYLSKRSILIQ